MVDFDPETVLQSQILYSIGQVSRELEHIATNVSHYAYMHSGPRKLMDCMSVALLFWVYSCTTNTL